MTGPGRWSREGALWAGALALGLASVGCGDTDADADADAGSRGRYDVDGGFACEDESRAQRYAAELSAVADTGAVAVRLVASVPAPPARFDNTWTLRVLDGAAVARDGASVAVTPFMPNHAHGTPVDVVVTPLGHDGLYLAEPVNLWMPGLWEVRVDVTLPGAVPARSVFAFCIAQ